MRPLPVRTLYRHRRFVERVLLCLFLLCAAAEAQNSMFNQRDDKYRLLGLKRAKEIYEYARAEYDRQKELFGKGMIAQTELERARASMADAEVNYQQSLLAVLFETQFVSVSSAVKYQTPDGVKHVRLTLANTSGGTEEFQKLVNIDDKLFRSLQPDVINYVYVSITNAEGAIISQPYEAKIEHLVYGKPHELTFALLQDLDAVTVNIIYGNGSSRQLKIYLQKDSRVNKVIVQSEQFSQEAELGKTATYDLRLELFSSDVGAAYSLEVVNLPAQIDRYFKDPATQARLTQFRFTESSNTRRAAVDITLPDRPTEEVAMGKPIVFYVLAVPRGNGKDIAGLQDRVWTQAEIERLNIGYVRLELVPRGKGRLLVRAQQLYHTIPQGQSIAMDIELVNEGTRRLDNVEVRIDPPLNWNKSVDPTVVASLDVGEEKKVRITLTPPAGVSAGRYESRIRTSALSDNQPVNAEDKTVTVEVQAEGGILGTTLLILLLVVLVGGIVYYGIRLSRR